MDTGVLTMANSLKNITIPLTGNLNMNRNESLTDSSFSIFNKQNSPVFGGSISPLHYKVPYTGDAKYSTDGSRWSVSNNRLFKDEKLFRDFSSSKSFEITDTKLDLDALIYYDDFFLGVKVDETSLKVYKYDTDFNILKTQTMDTFSSVHIFKGFKLALRKKYGAKGYFAVLAIGYENASMSSTSTPETIRVWKWNDTYQDFRIPDTVNFCFKTQNSSASFYKIENVENTNTSANWFFTMTDELGTATSGGGLDGEIGISVFRERPRGVDTFSSVYLANFLYQPSQAFTTLEEVAMYAGPVNALYCGTESSFVSMGEKRCSQGFFVDNSKVVLSSGHVQDTRAWAWASYMCYTHSFRENGTTDGLKAIYCQNSDFEGVHPAILVENGSASFDEISVVGSSNLTVNYNGYGRLVIAGFGQTFDNSDGVGAVCVNYTFDAQNARETIVNGATVYQADTIVNAGVSSTASIPTTSDGWNNWWKGRRYNPSNTCYNATGARLKNGNTNFYTLFNGRTGAAVAVSYSTDNDHIGTLLTEWGSIVDSFENCAVGDRVFFKDSKTNTVKYIEAKTGITLEDIDVVNNYVLVRCSADENIYDIVQDKWAKFANDWNNRLMNGYIGNQFVFDSGSNDLKFNYERWSRKGHLAAYSSGYANSGSSAAGYDVAYVKEKGFSPSRLYAYNTYSGIVYTESQARGAVLTAKNGLDVFGSRGSSSPSYLTTIYENLKIPNSNLSGSTYPITSSGSAYFNIPIIGSEVVDSYNGKYGLKIDDSCYTIAYDGIRPVALYNTSSMVDQVDDFFIVQSQYYALIKGYICSLSYSSSNNISGVEQIVCADGMQFIGAFPSCAYFYSPAARAIFAFTGDADLQLFVQTDRITEVYASKYYPNCEWIFMSTNDGIYVMSQNNTFRLNGDFGKVKNFYPTKDDYCVMVLEDGRNVFLSMTKKDGWTTIPVEVETAFFCDGDMKKSTITDWYIRVFKGDEDYNGKVTCSAKTMNDIVSQTIKTFDGKVDVKLTKDKFDENDNSMITLHTGCNALGTSCKVVSDYPIAYFGFTIGSDGSTAKSKYNI